MDVTLRRKIIVSLYMGLFVLFADALQAGKQPSINGIPVSANDDMVTASGKPLRASPATAAMHEGDTARRILQQRSTRGKSTTTDAVKVQRMSVEKTAIRPKRKTSTTQEKGIRKSNSLRPVTNGFNIPYESTVAALRVYHREYSDLVIPRKYIVPANDSYPEEWHGVDLARTVYDMKWWTRHIKEKPDRVAELNKLGFVWERLQPEWNLVLEALVTYGILHGSLRIPTKFVVPRGDKNWPRATWGIPLGNSVRRIRNRGDFLQGSTAVSRKDQLDALGFIWDTQDYRFQMFCSALRIYSNLESKQRANNRVAVLKIPAKFVVPSSNDWPKDLWGYQLGAKCTAIRQKDLYVKNKPERLLVLAELGFHFGGNDSLSWLEVVHAAAVYSQIHGGQLNVPTNFVVPAPRRLLSECDQQVESCLVGSDEAWPWPEYLWGFPLGQRLRDIRQKGYYMGGKSAEARRRQLDALGFNWKPKRGRPRK